jgi:mono/diheme cytochrome c family protein
MGRLLTQRSGMRTSAAQHRKRRRLLSFPRAPFLLLPVLVVAVGLAGGAEAPASSAEQVTYTKEIQPLFQQYCAGCHGPAVANAGVNLTRFATVTAIQQDQKTWRKVLKQLGERTMPPRGAPQPAPQQRERLAAWLTETLNHVDSRLLPRDPGRVLIHRLSRTEYNNTIRDLLGVDTRPADSFPPDGGGGAGFDNNADTLFVPPVLMEGYLQAASEILTRVKPDVLFFVRPGPRLPARAAARQIVARFAMRGFRRPVETAEVDRLMGLFDVATRRKEPFEAGVKLALKAILVSPSFLFRVERDQSSTEPYHISDYELASRLSYFLWSSMPDEALFRVAAQNRLGNPIVLQREVRRMLADPKARALADNFAGQWLRVRDLYTVAQPDPRSFPTYTPSLRDAMCEETLTFCDSVFRENASLLRLLDADYTFLNEELARHYGIEGVSGPELRRVTLKDGRRGGVLQMASILTLTSYPRRTSPVLRGKWVLEEIMGAPTPPPPPNAGGLPADDTPRQGLTFRQRLEQHRSKPECASCHSRMDPIGFGLENYDAIGQWRNEIGGTPVDASGTLASGEQFTGASELKRHLLRSREAFIHNLAEKMLAYALGRGLEPYDIPAVRRITNATMMDNCRSGTLIREIVRSYPFQYRKNP